ncbi:MAG TPA: cache domain-containing protein [Rhodopila sp.]|nr:cache domain-containing protein [Rhodopila sp.]
MLAALIATLPYGMTVQSARAGERDEVQALVERAVDYVRVNGRLRAFAAFNRPDGGFIKGDLYIFCDDAVGINLANGGNPNLVGHNLATVRDAEGKRPALDLYQITQAQGEGWYDFLWPNPATGRVERKIVFAKRIDDKAFCASGYYEPAVR